VRQHFPGIAAAPSPIGAPTDRGLSTEYVLSTTAGRRPTANDGGTVVVSAAPAQQLVPDYDLTVRSIVMTFCATLRSPSDRVLVGARRQRSRHALDVMEQFPTIGTASDFPS